MKKAIYAILALLAVIGMVSCGGGGGGDGTTVVPIEETTVTFNLNTAAILALDSEFDVTGLKQPDPVTVVKGDQIGSDLPTRAALLNEYLTDGFIFMSWNTKVDGSGAAITSASTFTEDAITLYAQWEKYEPVEVTFNTNGGWNAEGSAEDTTIVVSVQPGLTVNDTVDGMPGNPFKSGYEFTEWNTLATGLGSAFTGATVVDEAITVYAKYTLEVIIPSVDTTAGEEWVLLKNGWYAVYKFTLPDGAVWDDYESLSAEYNVPAKIEGEPVEWFTQAAGANAMRLLGNYKSTDFTVLTGTGTMEGKDLAVAVYRDNDPTNKNGPYMIDNSKPREKTVEGMVETEASAGTKAGDWWTVTYNITGTVGHSQFEQKNVPHPKASGPFFFGVGVTSGPSGYGTLQQIRNVTLKAKSNSGKDDVVATPAIFTNADGSKQYKAFTGWPTADGGNGYKEAYRGATRPEFDPGEPPAPPATEELEVTLPSVVVNTTEFSGDYNSPNGVFIPVTFPTDLNISSYEKFSITVKGSTTDNTTFVDVTADSYVQFDYVEAGVTGGDGKVSYKKIGGSGYNLKTAVEKRDVSPDVKDVASTFAGFLVYNGNQGGIKYVQVLSVTFYPPPAANMGTVKFTIEDDVLKDPVSGIANADLILSRGNLVISAPAGFSTYSWKVNGIADAETTKDLTLKTSTYFSSIGKKVVVSLVVKDADGNSYSKTVIITVKE